MPKIDFIALWQSYFSSNTFGIFEQFWSKPVGSQPVVDPENFGGGGFEAKTSKIRMSSPKLRLIFWPKSEIQRFFSPKIRRSPKKKEKRSSSKLRLIFRSIPEIQTFFSPKIRWSPKKKKKKRRSSPKLRLIFRPKSEIQTFFFETDFSAEIGNSNVFFAQNQVVSKKKKKKKRSSPKLRLIFRPKSEIQTFFSPKIRWSPKKKKGLHQN